MRVSVLVAAMLIWASVAMAADQPGPPPLPDTAKVEYYVAENGQPVGPLTLAQLEERVRQGQTKPADLAWKTGLAEWAAAQTFAELQAVFEKDAPPPLPRKAGFEQLMVGTWETSWQQEGWLMTVRTAYAPDGSYTGVMIGNPPGGQPIQMPVHGTWTLLPLEGQSFTLSQKDVRNQTSTATVRVIDPNTLENLDTGTTLKRVAM